MWVISLGEILKNLSTIQMETYFVRILFFDREEIFGYLRSKLVKLNKFLRRKTIRRLTEISDTTSRLLQKRSSNFSCHRLYITAEMLVLRTIVGVPCRFLGFQSLC